MGYTKSSNIYIYMHVYKCVYIYIWVPNDSMGLFGTVSEVILISHQLQLHEPQRVRKRCGVALKHSLGEHGLVSVHKWLIYSER